MTKEEKQEWAVEVEANILSIGEAVDNLKNKVLRMVVKNHDSEELAKLGNLHRLVIEIGNSAVDAFAEALVIENEAKDD